MLAQYLMGKSHQIHIVYKKESTQGFNASWKKQCNSWYTVGKYFDWGTTYLNASGFLLLTHSVEKSIKTKERMSL